MITFYFANSVPTMSLDDALKFVSTFGAYLNLSESLAIVSYLHLDKVIDLLLDMASKYDMMHQKAWIEFDAIARSDDATGLTIGKQARNKLFFC